MVGFLLVSFCFVFLSLTLSFNCRWPRALRWCRVPGVHRQVQAGSSVDCLAGGDLLHCQTLHGSGGSGVVVVMEMIIILTLTTTMMVVIEGDDDGGCGNVGDDDGGSSGGCVTVSGGDGDDNDRVIPMWKTDCD